jgi:hypothetical protein
MQLAPIGWRKRPDMVGVAQYMPVASTQKAVVFAAIYGFAAWIPGLGVRQFGAHKRITVRCQRYR